MSRIQWGEHERQALYVEPGSGSGPWFVVIHGGAWRDSKITWESGNRVLEDAKQSHRFSGFASLDYRLSPEIQHPEHMQDVAEDLQYLIQHYYPPSITVLGHSCGAFLAGQIYPQFRDKISSVIGLEGIYNLELLVEEYPSYASFVNSAFGSHWPSLNWKDVPLRVVQSPEDELLSLNQSQWVANEAASEVELLKGGSHDEVFEHPQCSYV